ncbi:sugar ABC transporter ATP-binding protein [Paenibacillus frigoriresistens]|uniref:sugar ABC transporter ATP-binding protein n=1 Tax=Paenibacillus alginolyticus TaxID=59839 RepID=UPI001563B424|nr:sugar ABC transporter ATP-binding protein [Paenibacillus frigoriresistens]NRF95913.1 sugar ABC transporter ATP-binding protein [Paenibacillus frigoriresistens]
MNKSTSKVNQPPFLEMRNISKSYSGVKVLHNVNLKINSGEILALIGENGAGKSTLIKILSGAIKADAGEILINGQRKEFQSPLDAERNEVVTVYQELNLFSHLSVAENLFFTSYHKMKGFLNWSALRKEAQHFLHEFGVNLPADKRVSSLSIAEKQMLEIAKALYRKASVLILDEPTAVLGGKDVNRLLKIITRMKDRGVAIIFISHRLNEIFGFADRYLVLKDGQQMDDGRIDETTPDELVRKMVGRELNNAPHTSINYEKKQELLRVEGLSREGALNNINFSLYKGELLGIAGLRGAGRTELARAIFGADPIDTGKIFVMGREIKINSPRKAINTGIGLVPEDRGSQGLFKNLSSLQNIFMACIKMKKIRKNKERNIAKHYVESLQIKLPNLGALVGSLSGGNQQKVVLAKWLEAGIQILLLDEPTRGIDIGAKAQIYRVVQELCDQGMGVILISSELPEILENSDRILVMHKGEIAGELDRESASEETIMKYAVGAAAEKSLTEYAVGGT